MNIKYIPLTLSLFFPIFAQASCNGSDIFNSTDEKSYGTLKSELNCDTQSLHLTSYKNNSIPSTNEQMEKGKKEASLMCILAPDSYNLNLRSIKITEILSNGDISNAQTIYCNEVLFNFMKEIDNRSK
ncbi:hypothetical protein [Photobacterium leiognathi]|uniref:hypothetical protein n=1 Tax=Photobacterium leiognathi TaxID=553611 RepID=UPI0027360515|nr:hypothetical protein [Photobacterium leiognathi]